jgi:predicted nuclease of restriction endonuclease-like (RecB) superfamily
VLQMTVCYWMMSFNPFRMSQQSTLFPENYEALLRSLKARIRQAQVRAALAVNSELILMYWEIGREILERQRQEGWGSKVIERLAQDLKREFPAVKGFSRTNLTYMRAFAEAYSDQEFVHQLGGQIPWKHNCILIDKVKDHEQRVWYIQKTIENGWSRDILALQIETNLYQRQGGATTTFSRTLLPPQSDLAQQIIKDPYNLQFLTLDETAQERDLELALVSHIQSFLLELGVGFAFVGRQYHIEVGGEDFYIDLLFYHLKLRCYVVIELKAKEFRPVDTGQLNFYLSAVDNLLRHPDDQPTIGILLCRSKNQTIAEFALQDLNKPIGIASYMLRDSLPSELQANLPSIEQLELEVATVVAEIEGQSVDEV